MRAGIPKPLWKGVVTVYKDGEIIQAFTGNDTPNNARVILIDKNGKIIHFYDQGFSVNALNNLRDSLQTSR
jgi:cytochrome oxidase Cu insertion factor (SCO1/SenC/PrrC family)